MKKILSLCLFLLIFFISNNNIINAITYEEASKDSKAMAILIYADWADDVENIKTNFETIQNKYSNYYNFILLNLADTDTKEYNKKYHIYPNLPYVMLFRNNAKISRCLQKNCLQDMGCFEEKLKNFTN